jgi:hypothetical protein
MNTPSWYEEPPEDPEETAEHEQDYFDFLYDQSQETEKEVTNLDWDTPTQAPFNKRNYR